MKVIKKTAAVRRYYTSLLAFLLALGLVPASFISNGTKAEAETKVAEANPENTPMLRNELATVEPDVAEIATDYMVSLDAPADEITVATDDFVGYHSIAPDVINIAGNYIPIFYSSNTLIDAGNEVGLYGEHFMYGHNTSHVFGGLRYLGVGDRFTVTLGGVTRTYQIMNTDTREKSYFEGSFYRQKKMPGMVVFESVKIMKAITANGEYQGQYYDYILMTCAGTSYGNGDASHRLILMANEI
ncbi:hypothetical protein IJ114_02105 [Candidatus Saccharibacteria bacterium]|nr:hypothetical protein [Candidatus Saccharibacteria bacterium]